MLELHDVNAYRGAAHVLRGISLQVDTAEVVCLVGRNGSGKTTTIDCIMGLLPVRSGTVALQGRDLTRLPPHRRAQQGIGYAPEDTGIFPDLTVAENLQISQWLVGTSRHGTTPAAPAETERKIFELGASEKQDKNPKFNILPSATIPRCLLRFDKTRGQLNQ
jgi:ABC-type branched-subunit amino acid transport system ATPase component